jgi:Tol biopolymer transport system component
MRQITTDTSDYGSVSVSADGSTIVTTRVDTISSIWSFNPQSREMRQINAENKNLLGFAGISQMPDGKILYVKNVEKDIHIFMLDENGGNEKQLTTGMGQNISPVATPDGKYIIFCSNRDSSSYSVWRMNIDGSNSVRLTNAPNFSDGMTQITADGKYVLFMRQTNDGGNSKIMKVSIDGGEAIPLLPQDSKAEYFPLVSPDNKKLVYHTLNYDDKSGNLFSSIKIVGFDGENVNKSVFEKELKLNPDYKWSPDSKFLTYINRSGIPNLWNISLDDLKRETPLTDFNSGMISNFIWSKDGKKLFIIRSVVNTDLVLIKDSNKV